LILNSDIKNNDDISGLELFLSCENLENRDLTSKSDSFVTVFR
jgi:hypothetical protein